MGFHIFLRQVVLAIAVALAGAAPQDPEQRPLPILRDEGVALAGAAPRDLEKEPLEILRDERVVPVNGIYSFQVETENGIVQSEEGVVGSKGQTNVQGSYR